MTWYLLFVTLMSVVGVLFAARNKFSPWFMAYLLLGTMSFSMAVCNMRHGGIEWLSKDEYKLIQGFRATKGVNK